ncbi:GtrA family protein [Tessaracoccus sp. MC1679]|nr:GtrA family protein [Tessaracoccus sp. MC1679]
MPTGVEGWPVIKKMLHRYRSSIRQLFRFGMVGGLGVVVNMAVIWVQRHTLPIFWPESAYGGGAWWSIPGTEFNIRWYHVMSMAAFMVANLVNFQLNRWWTFGSHKHSAWWREYWPFLTVGLAAQLIGMGLLTLLMWEQSPIALPSDVFDNSSGLRTKFYWAQLIMIFFTIPVSFLLNKFWTFRSIRTALPPVEAA